MESTFCEHLDSYAELYAETDMTYRVCLKLIEKRLAGDVSDTLVKQIQQSLRDWERQTRTLRSNFVVLKEKGRVLLPRPGQNTSPVCGQCGKVVPRLEFPDFEFQEGGSVLFRGKELRTPETIPA